MTSEPVTQDSGGRRAKALSMSLLPEKQRELAEFVALTSIGPTNLYRDLVAPKVRAANWAIREMKRAGMELDYRNLPDTIWATASTDSELADLYSGAKIIAYPTP